MITKRPAEQRGHANYGWLDTWHSFSFADYHDPEHMGRGPLRVINDDTVSAGNSTPDSRLTPRVRLQAFAGMTG